MNINVCFKCDEGAPDMSYNDMIKTCARCRDVLKADLVKLLLDCDEPYLNEFNRNKNGRPRKLTANDRHDIKYRYIREHQQKRAGLRKHAVTYKELAQEYSNDNRTISASLIKKVVHS